MKKITFCMIILLTLAGFKAYSSELLREETQLVDSHGGMLGTFTFTTRWIHDSQKIEEMKSKFHYAPIESEELVVTPPPYSNQRYDIFGMGENRIAEGEDKILYTPSIVDCIGISVFDPLRKIACLDHASKMELQEETQWLFHQYFIGVLKEKIDDLARAEVNICSCYWSKDVLTVIRLMQEAGFRIKGLSIPDMLVENDEFERRFYVNKNLVSQDYLKEPPAPQMIMVLNTSNGKVGIKFNP